MFLCSLAYLSQQPCTLTCLALLILHIPSFQTRAKALNSSKLYHYHSLLPSTVHALVQIVGTVGVVLYGGRGLDYDYDHDYENSTTNDTTRSLESPTASPPSDPQSTWESSPDTSSPHPPPRTWNTFTLSL